MFKKSYIIKTKHLTKPINFNNNQILFFTLLICGVIIGCFVGIKENGSLFTFYKGIIENYISALSSSNFLIVVSSIFALYFIIILLQFLNGLCGFGSPLLFLTPIFLGGMFGIWAITLYRSFGLYGLGFCFLINVPSFSILTGVIIKCCQESNTLSKNILFYVISGKALDNEKISLKDYTLRYLVYLIPVFISALTGGLLFKLFKGLFPFIS